MTSEKERLRRIAEFYNAETVNYDSGYSNEVCKAEDLIVANVLRENISGAVLDIGAGSGLLCEMLNIEDYTGVEISGQMTSLAKQKFPEKDFTVGDMHKLPFADESFDSVVSLYGPLSYSLAPEELVKEIKRVVRPGGFVALMPYTLRVHHGLDIGGYSTAIEPGIEKKFYTEADLRYLLKDFEEVEVLGVNYFLNTLTRFMEQIGGSQELNRYNFADFLEMEKIFKNVLPAEYARHMMGMGKKRL